jgi:nitric oxide reductase NorQ protein
MSRGWEIPPSGSTKWKSAKKRRPWTPPSRKVSAADVIKKLEGVGAVTTAPDPPPQPSESALPPPPTAKFGEILITVAKVRLSPADADEIVEDALEQSDGFSASKLNQLGIAGLSPSQTIVHPAFIQAAAKRCVAFYLDDRGKVHYAKVESDDRPKLGHAEIDKDSIDPDFYWSPPWAEHLKEFVNRGAPVLLLGGAGCGKTETTERVFAERGQKLLIVNCTPKTTADDLEGTIDLVIEDGHQVTSFTPAAPAVASENGWGLLLDEADAAQAEAMYSVYRLLDGKPMHILRKGADCVVERNENFRVVGTQNTEGRGDDRNMFHGRAYQDEAFLDRWGNAIRVDYPAADIETLILRKRTGISSSQAKRLVESAHALRNALVQDEIMFCCSVRRTIQVASNLAAGFTPELAWEFAVINKATPDDGSKVREALGRIYGSKLKSHK